MPLSNACRLRDGPTGAIVWFRYAFCLLLVAPWGLVAPAEAASTAARRGKLTICGQSTPKERQAALRLAQWLGFSEVALVKAPGCTRAGTRYVGWFEQRGRGVVFALRVDGARPLTRRVPWLCRCAHPLTQLAAQSRLSEFSILLHSLIVERQALAAIDRRPARPQPAPAAKSPAPKSTVTRIVEPVASPSVETKTPLTDRPAPGAVETRRAPAPNTAETPTLATTSPPAGKTAPDSAPEQTRPPPPKTVKSAAPPTSLARVSHEVTPRRSAGSMLQRLSFAASIWGRSRSAEVLAPELSLSAAWYGVTLRVGYQIPVEWDLEARPLRVQGLHLGLGWAPALWRPGRWRLQAHLMLLFEQTWVERLDLEWADSHGLSEIGGSAGLSLARLLPRGLSVALHVEGAVYPGSGDIIVPFGPTVQLNLWSLRFGLRLQWHPWSG